MSSIQAHVTDLPTTKSRPGTPKILMHGIMINVHSSNTVNYRYHGGESYRDLVHRLEPIILELERHHEPNHAIYIIGHQAVVRAIYAYFHNIPHEDLAYIKIPLHTVIKLSPKAYVCHEEKFRVDVPAVDTFRSKPDPKSPGKVPVLLPCQ